MNIEVAFTLPENGVINTKIREFVDEMSKPAQSGNYYATNRSTSVSKSLDDIFVGKKAEYFAAKYLTSLGFPEIDIDLEIRRGKKKGWNVDLPYNSFSSFPDVHVKSCSKKTLRYCHDYSWTFQANNSLLPGGRDTIFDDNESFLCLVYLDDALCDKAVIKAFLPWSTAQKYLRDPLKLSLVGLKKCIYYSDLIT